MSPKPQPQSGTTALVNPRFENTVMVIYMSPGVPVDGGGFVVIVGTDKNGNQILKIVPVGPGPGDPQWRVVEASAGLLNATQGVAGVEELRSLAATTIQHQVQTALRGQVEN